MTISRFASPEDRRALSALSLVCQGAAPEVAECMVEQMAAEYRRMFEQERMVEQLTAEQQDFLLAAQAECTEAEG